MSARITSANQKWMEVPGDEDDGIDMMVEFTEEDGNGKGLCLQLKVGNSHLTPQGRHLVFPRQFLREKHFPRRRKRECVTVPWMTFRVSCTCTALVGVLRDLWSSLFERIGFTHDR